MEPQLHIRASSTKPTPKSGRRLLLSGKKCKGKKTGDTPKLRGRPRKKNPSILTFSEYYKLSEGIRSSHTEVDATMPLGSGSKVPKGHQPDDCTWLASMAFVQYANKNAKLRNASRLFCYLKTCRLQYFSPSDVVGFTRAQIRASVDTLMSEGWIWQQASGRYVLCGKDFFEKKFGKLRKDRSVVIHQKFTTKGMWRGFLDAAEIHLIQSDLILTKEQRKLYTVCRDRKSESGDPEREIGHWLSLEVLMSRSGKSKGECSKMLKRAKKANLVDVVPQYETQFLDGKPHVMSKSDFPAFKALHGDKFVYHFDSSTVRKQLPNIVFNIAIYGKK